MALISRQLLRRRPQELGRIKIGGLGKEMTSRQGKTFQPPVKFDAFLVTTHVRGDDGNFIRDERIHAEIGDSPTELAGVLMFERPEENFHAEMVQFKGRKKDGKVWSCDGETAHNLKNGKTGPCVKAAGGDCACKPYARLHLQLWASPYTMGYHVFRTTSWESTNNIQTALEEIYERFGTCYNAPVKLVLYPSEDRREDGVSTSHKVGLVLAMGMAEVAGRMAEARGYAELASGQVRQLAAGVQEDLTAADAQEAEYIAKEYFPAVTDQEVHATTVAQALHAEEPETLDAEVVEEEPKDSRLENLNRRYFAMLKERGMDHETDRRVFQKRLHTNALVTGESCTSWNVQDYRSAIAELADVPKIDDVPRREIDEHGSTVDPDLPF